MELPITSKYKQLKEMVSIMMRQMFMKSIKQRLYILMNMKKYTTNGPKCKKYE